MTPAVRVLVLSVFIARLHAPCRCQGLTAHIEWEENSQGDIQPRLDGMGHALPQDAASAAETVSVSQRRIDDDTSERRKQQAASDTFDLQVSPAGDGCLSPTELEPGMYGLAVSRLGVKCKGCAEREDYVQAAQKFLSKLSVRSLKNILSVRGVGCRECRTREQLQMAALHAATIEPKNVTLPLYDSGGGAHEVVCFPRGVVYVNAVDLKSRLLVERALASNQHFALKQGDTHAILGKILEHTEVDGSLRIKVRCGQRIRVVNTIIEPNTHGLQYCKGYLFVDHPVFRRDASQLDEMQKRLRRLFFVLDTDASANARIDTIKNPPEESEGPETLSHWISQAICTPHMHTATVSDVSLTRFLLWTRNTTRRLDVLDDYLQTRRDVQERAGKASKQGSSK